MTTALPSNVELLAEAKLAYHKLMTGTAVVTVRDSNGELITFNPASADKLKTYIQELTDAVNGPCGRVSGPMRIWM